MNTHSSNSSSIDAEFDTRKKRRVVVTEVQDITASIRRLTLRGADLAALPTFDPTGWAKIFVPGAEGAPSPGRAYTLRNQRSEAGEIDIDVVLHNDGPLTTWARHVVSGEEAFFAGPRGGFLPSPSSQWLLLAGDLSALPAIASILEVLPPLVTPFVVAGVSNEADLSLIPSAYRQSCVWTDRGDEELQRLTFEMALPDAPGEVWAAGEAAFVRATRRHFLLDRKMEKGTVHCTGYWKLGAQDHRDSERPE